MEKKSVSSFPHIIFCYELFRSGETNAVNQIIKELKNHKINTHKVITYPEKSGSFINVFTYLFKNSWKYFIKIRRFPKNYLIFTTTYTIFLTALLLNTKKRIIFNYHGNRLPKLSHNSLLINKISYLIKYNIIFILHKTIFNKTNFIIVPSAITKNEILKTYNLSNASKIIVIPNTIPGNFRRKYLKRNAVIKKWNGEKIITYVGIIDPRKKINLLIKSFKNLLAYNQDYLLLIVYLKPYSIESKNYLKKLIWSADKLLYSKKIIWIEEFKDIRLIYSISDLTILLSEWESFPLVLLESFSCGCLFAGSPRGEINNFLSSIDRKLIIESKTPRKISQKIYELTNIPTTHKNEIIKNAQELIRRRYGQKIVTDQYLKLIQSIKL